MEYLKVRPDYIHILLEEGSDFMEYLNDNPKPKYVYISCTKSKSSSWFEGDGFDWSWFEEDYEKHMSSQGCKYIGEINLRKEKLKKINELR
jgi:hypothetical protein